MNPKKFANSQSIIETKLQQKITNLSLKNAVLRINLHTLKGTEGLPDEVLQAFSAMKYGDPVAVTTIARSMAQKLLSDQEFQLLLSNYDSVFLSSSAFGSVPSAAFTVAEMLADFLLEADFKVTRFKLIREGGFDRTNYGTLESEAREKAIRSRKILIEPDVCQSLQNQLIVVFDDLRSTGAHERAVLELLQRETPNASIVFCYAIGFGEGVKAAQEDALNHAFIKRPENLLPLFQQSSTSPILNARLLKSILLLKGKRFQNFLNTIGETHALRLYEAAISSDAYFNWPRFRDSFALLENWLFDHHAIAARKSFSIRNRLQSKIVAFDIAERPNGMFVDASNESSVNEWIEIYSRFKFGDVPSIRKIADVLARVFIKEIVETGLINSVFISAKQRGEFIHITAPGVRNVVSASNYLMRELAAQVNVWLSKNALPTMIVRSLVRLGSGRDNYAALNARQRNRKEKTTQTIVPKSEYREFPSHVFFLDDVEVTGQTANRARVNSLAARALSFHSIFAFRVDPLQAQHDASVEHRLNHFLVSESLDAVFASILLHPDYQPVQRAIRLLLHPRNASELSSFLRERIPDLGLVRIYQAAMNNDYLWIQAKEPGQVGIYGPSLMILEAELQRRNLTDELGLIVGQ